MQSSTDSRYFHHLTSKYSPQHPVLKRISFHFVKYLRCISEISKVCIFMLITFTFSCCRYKYVVNKPNQKRKNALLTLAFYCDCDSDNLSTRVCKTINICFVFSAMCCIIVAEMKTKIFNLKQICVRQN
jgi:hypothetical protein